MRTWLLPRLCPRATSSPKTGLASPRGGRGLGGPLPRPRALRLCSACRHGGGGEARQGGDGRGERHPRLRGRPGVHAGSGAGLGGGAGAAFPALATGASAGTHAGAWGLAGAWCGHGLRQGLLGIPSVPRGGRAALQEGVPAPRPLRCGGHTGGWRASPCLPGSSGEHCRAVCSHHLERTGFSLYHIFVVRQASLDFFLKDGCFGGRSLTRQDHPAQPPRAAPGWGSRPEGSGPRALLGGTWPLSSRNSGL